MDIKHKSKKEVTPMEEQFEEFEDEEEILDDEEEEEPRPVMKGAKNPQPRQGGKFVSRNQPPEPKPKQPVKQQPQPVREEPKEEKTEITGEDLVAAIQNHEQRLVALESALFRLKGAI